MNKAIIVKNCLLLAFFTAFSLNTQAQSLGNVERGVVVNGVRWATRNVDEPGRFAARPESAGRIFQWNRRKAWSASGSVQNWDYPAVFGQSWSWERSNDPCPRGWRVPTAMELQSLVDAGSIATTRNGVNGRLFGTGRNQIFLPAAGARDRNGGVLMGVNEAGFYWSSTRYDGYTNAAISLEFFPDEIGVENYHFRADGMSIRCVAE